MNDDIPAPWHLTAPSFGEIEEAAERIRGVLVETPMLESERLNARVGGRLLVKAERLQRTGSFKARGAWNRLSLWSAEERARGVVAFSSGMIQVFLANVGMLKAGPEALDGVGAFLRNTLGVEQRSI
jgi:hypothetical protein